VSAAPYPLRYVCKYCGITVATFPSVAATEPATLSVCDNSACREQAAKEWRGAA
jgi:ribosome-binding protein aMBF1 (putative translation factor)